MKIFFTKTLTVISISLMFTLSSCQKGDTGAPGAAGSANVTATNYSVPAANWGYSSPNFYADLGVPGLTTLAQSSGVVEVFFSNNSGINWQAIPYTYYNSPGANYLMNFSTTVGSVRIFWTYNTSISTGQDPSTFFGVVSQFKVVVIPPSAMKPNVNYQNYYEVKAAYNLKD